MTPGIFPQCFVMCVEAQKPHSPAPPRQTSSCPEPGVSGIRTRLKIHRSLHALYLGVHQPIENSTKISSFLKWFSPIHFPTQVMQSICCTSTNLLKLSLSLLGREIQVFV